jgi:hypothetical protein
LHYPVLSDEALLFTNLQHQAFTEMANIMLPLLPTQFPTPPITPAPTFHQSALPILDSPELVPPTVETQEGIRRQSQQQHFPTPQFRTWRLQHQANIAVIEPQLPNRQSVLNLSDELTTSLATLGANLPNDSVLRVAQEEIAPLLRVPDDVIQQAPYDSQPHHAFQSQATYVLSAITCDTGQAAIYGQLLNSAEGHLWEQARTKEIEGYAMGEHQLVDHKPKALIQ